jgi:uncharacterized protein
MQQLRSSSPEADTSASTDELSLLEGGATAATESAYRANVYGLKAAPIVASWIISGTPVARTKRLFTGADGTASTYMWDCTAGRFNWFYDCDETICLVEGSVVLKDASGAVHRLGPGDAFYFPIGSRFEWTVEHYVRKIAFIHEPLPRMALRVARAWTALARLMRPGGAPKKAAAFGAGV